MDESRVTTPARAVAVGTLLVTIALLFTVALAVSPVVSAGGPGDDVARETRPGGESDFAGGDGAVGVADGAAVSRQASAGVRQADPPADTLVTRIRLHPNGSATWVIEIRTLITNETDVDDYRRFQSRFRNDTDQYISSFRERIVRLVETAANATDRPMRADSFTASTRIEGGPRQYGVVEYRFRWTGFAAERDGGLAVGDVFESGYYLGEDELLIVDAPPDHEIDTAAPTPDTRDDAVVGWSGPVDFGDGRPSVRTVGGDATGATGPDTGTEPAANDDPFPLPLLGVGVGVVALVSLGAFLLRSRDRNSPENGGESDGRDEPEDDGHPGGAGNGGTDDQDEDGGGDGGVPVDDETLLTDEERVVTLLERNGGRMRQSDIADELGWSASKTSRTLSSMDGDEIEKFRLGNENVIDLVEE